MSSLEEASELGYKDKFLLKPNWQLQLSDNYFKDQKKKKNQNKNQGVPQLFYIYYLS